MALATHSRVSELANINRKSFQFSTEGAKFQLLVPTKTQSSFSLRVLQVARLANESCPVLSIEYYLSATSTLSPNANKLFVSFKAPYDVVSPSTIARWIKSVLSLSGINVEKYSAHSTRGASASHAVTSGTPIDEILHTANWRSESTFTRFYRRT